MGGGGTTDTQTISLMKTTTLFHVHDRLLFNHSSLLQSNTIEPPNHCSPPSKSKRFILIYAHYMLFIDMHILLGT